MSKPRGGGTKSSNSKKNPISKGKPPTLAELQEAIEILKTENCMLRNNLNPEKIEEEIRKNNNVSQEDMVSLLYKQNRSLEKAIKELESSTGTSSGDVTQLNQEIEALKKEKNTHTAQMKQKETTIDNLSKQLKEAKNLAEVRAKEIAEKGAPKSAVSDEKLQKQIDELENQLKAKDDQIKMMVNQNAKIEDLTKEKEKEKDEKEDLQKKISRLEKQLKDSNSESEINASKPSEENLEKEKKELQSAVEKRDDTIKEQKNLIEKIQTDLNRDLNEEKDRRKELEKVLQDLQAKIKENEMTIKSKEKLIQTLQSSTDEDTKNEKVLKAKDEEISSLKQELEKLKSDNEKLKETLAKSNEENKKKLNDQNNRMKQLEDEHKKDIKKKETDNETLKKEKEVAEKSSQENIKKLTEQKNRIKQMEEEHKEEIKKKDATIADLKKEKTGSDKTRGTSSNTDTKGLRDRHEQTVRELSEAKSEVSELKYRLSQVVGAKVMDDNPNITDLSDENRPTKLSEKYSELYDNEWTDAYEEAENEYKTEQEVIKHLYQKLLDISAFCQKISEEYAMKLKSCALTIPSAENGRPKSANIGVTNLRQLKELRKSFSPHLVENVFQHYMKTKKLDLKKRVKTEKFIRECVKICWLMSSQDPPVIFDTSNVTGTFDGDKFRTYTKSGKFFDFVVWPPMLLHKNGPMLCKGVAQGK